TSGVISVPRCRITARSNRANRSDRRAGRLADRHQFLNPPTDTPTKRPHSFKVRRSEGDVTDFTTVSAHRHSEWATMGSLAALPGTGSSRRVSHRGSDAWWM